MGKTVHSAKDIVIERAENRCEKCKVELTRNTHGIRDRLTDRSVHHRQPKRRGGKDSVWCMVTLCLGCHKAIHADEELAAKDGWITDRHPARVPFKSWRGWVLPQEDGSLDLVDFEAGRVLSLTAPVRVSRKSRGRQHRPRRSSRPVPSVA